MKDAVPGAERSPKRKELLEGLPVYLWVNTVRAAWEAGVDERTLYNWRAVGLPAKQENDGTWWYALPHLHVWHGVLIYRQAAQRSVDHLSFKVALAHHRLLSVEMEEDNTYRAPAPRRGRYSSRNQ